MIVASLTLPQERASEAVAPESPPQCGASAVYCTKKSCPPWLSSRICQSVGCVCMKKFFGAPPPTISAPFFFAARTSAAVSSTSSEGSIGTRLPSR